jgi:hypothetical protein
LEPGHPQMTQNAQKMQIVNPLDPICVKLRNLLEK